MVHPPQGVQIFRGRYLFPFLGISRGGSAVIVAGRVYLLPVVVPHSTVVDRIILIKGAAIAGNLHAGLYEDEGDTPQGGAALVDSGSIAVSAGVNRKQAVTIADTHIESGVIWVALEFDNVVNQIEWAAGYGYQGDQPNNAYYDRVAGYGALTDPCPVITWSTMPIVVWLRRRTG